MPQQSTRRQLLCETNLDSLAKQLEGEPSKVITVDVEQSKTSPEGKSTVA
jgi:hypothetical protein